MLEESKRVHRNHRCNLAGPIEGQFWRAGSESQADTGADGEFHTRLGTNEVNEPLVSHGRYNSDR